MAPILIGLSQLSPPLSPSLSLHQPSSVSHPSSCVSLSLPPLERTDLRRCPGILLQLSASVLAAERTVRLRRPLHHPRPLHPPPRRTQTTDPGKTPRRPRRAVANSPVSPCAPETHACCLNAWWLVGWVRPGSWRRFGFQNLLLRASLGENERARVVPGVRSRRKKGGGIWVNSQFSLTPKFFNCV